MVTLGKSLAAGLASAIALAVYIALQVGVRLVLLASLTAVVAALRCDVEVLLAGLICWAVGRIPQRYQWSIDRVQLRPSWSDWRGGWSEVVVVGWTWHNAVGFDDEDMLRGTGYLLQIDELEVRLKLSSIWGALREHKSVKVCLLRAHGVRFSTNRNKQGALNLWRNLDLTDDDVNVKCFASQARKFGGLSGGGATVVPLPPIATAATRRVSGFWKTEWGRRPGSEPQSDSSEERDAQLQDAEMRYVEEPIGARTRRPRWGIPLRFDIHQVEVADIQLWVLDLLTLDVHRTSQAMGRDRVRIDLPSLEISRERLEAGDKRRAGAIDGVRGVYLGELVWVLVAELIPPVVMNAPGACSFTAAVATGLAIKDATKMLGAKTVQAAHFIGHNIKEALNLFDLPEPDRRSAPGAALRLKLIRGRQVTRKGRSVNCHAFIELLNSAGSVVDKARSEPQMWTKVPHWGEHFLLGPATSVSDAVRVTLYHRKSRQVVGITSSAREMPERYIGEVTLPLRCVLIQDAVIAEGGEVVGWFELTDDRGLRKGIPCSGEVKLGLQVIGAERLSEASDGGESSDASLL
mmetsp:Transcript_39026/g.112092  ORF Transcript_39026/g.112092 Transcript_39026/m.112092 type:complete len:576 (-) Transcript_39026:115-1842(-)